MKLLFDARVLIHKHYTGVENYTKNILEKLSQKLQLNIVKPKNDNKYLAHLWSHFILPFKSGNILFCPANIAPLYVPKSKKLIITIHDVAFLTYPDSFSAIFRFYYRWLMPIVVKRADTIITVSQSSKKEILKYYPYAKDKIEVIYLGLDEKYKIIDSIVKEKIILYVGSLNERKNFTSVIEAFELLNLDDYTLLIIGNFSSNFLIDDKTNKILKRAKEKDNIEFKSNILDEELVKIYNKATLLIFPSFYEGFGLPPLEAMACGTPVITSNLTSMPEVCGDAAVYINPYKVKDIKEKIEMLIENEELQQQIIQKGLERVKQFDWEKASVKHIDIFKKAMKN